MRVRLVIMISLFAISGRLCFANSIPAVPATYEVEATTPDLGTVINTIGSSTVNLFYSSSPVAGFPYSAAQATAGPNHLGIYAGAGAAAQGFTLGTSDNSEVWAYSTDHLLLQNSPQTGYLSVLASILGFDQVQQGGSGYGSTETLYRVSTVFGSDCVSTASTFGGCGTPVLGKSLPGLSLLQVPYSLASDGTTPFGEEFTSYNYCDVTLSSSGGYCSAQSFFFDTAQIASITVEDAKGNVVPGATVTSLAGVDYSLPQSQSTVPEPSAFVLAGSGLVGLLSFSRGRFS